MKMSSRLLVGLFSVKEDHTVAHGMQWADVCIICALEEEANAVEQVIGERCEAVFSTSVTHDGRFTYRCTIITNNKGEQLVLALLCQTHPGPVSAALDLRTQLQLFQPCFVGMSGICAGDKRQMRLGDLVVAEYAYHFEEGKVTRDEIGEVIHQPEGITYSPASHVLQYVRAFGAWRTPVAELKQRLFKSDESPRCVMTLMASGMAVRGDDPFETLQRQHRRTWALDMEAASFYLALHAFPNIGGLVVKGVVDYADHFKDDAFHDFAARASALYLLTFIQEYVTTNALLHQHSSPAFTLPSARSASFTGREEPLIEIRFQARPATAIRHLQAICGPGDIDKTQIDEVWFRGVVSGQSRAATDDVVCVPCATGLPTDQGNKENLTGSPTSEEVDASSRTTPNRGSHRTFAFNSPYSPDGFPFALGKRRGLRRILLALVLLLIIGSARTLFSQTRDPAPTQANKVAREQASKTAIAGYPGYLSGSGTLAFFDPLSQTNQWSSSNNTDRTCQFTGGAYHVNQQHKGFLNSCFAHGIFSDFAFEVQLTITQGDCGGMTFRDDDNGHFYFLLICENGIYGVIKYVSPGSADIKLLLSGSSAIHTGLGQQNKMAVVASGSTMTFYVNEQQIDHEQDSNYTSGKIALVSYSITSNIIDVAYSNAKLWTL